MSKPYSTKFIDGKLMLTSSDIQVGDKVYANYSTEDNSIIINNKTELTLALMSTPKPYKVIGEISEQAIWVKEGDDFNEEDIKSSYKDSSGATIHEQWYSKMKKYDKSRAKCFTVLYKIKGPCGHCH
jgi:hypothetical protein